MAGIISLILWFALLGSLAWFLVKPKRIGPHAIAHGDVPHVPVPGDSLGHFGGATIR